MRSQGRYINSNDSIIWPGFVDALSAVLLVFIFVLLIFVVSQFYLSEMVSGKDKSIDQFKLQISQLSDQLNFLETEKLDLITTIKDKDTQQRSLANTLEILKRDYENSKENLETTKLENLNTKKEISLLSDQLTLFNQQIQKLTAALSINDSTIQSQRIRIDKLTLDNALAQKVEEMARYRSDFFESLEKALGDRDDMRIEGDRFVFQSEVLFETAAAELESGGQETIDQLAETLTDIIEKIPDTVNWVLRIDGHTDKRPMRGRFKSNWELSFARAMAVVRRLIKAGIPANRLAATGFGENYPIDDNDSDDAYLKNRRIEIKLDQR